MHKKIEIPYDKVLAFLDAIPLMQIQLRKNNTQRSIVSPGLY